MTKLNGSGHLPPPPNALNPICPTCHGFGSVIVKVDHPTKGIIKVDRICDDCGGSGVQTRKK